MLLSVIPYIAGIAVYYDSYQTQFRRASSPFDPQWRWIISRPILLSGLAPLAAASSGAGRNGFQVWLLSAAAVGILLTTLIMTLLKNDHYFTMFRPIALRRTELTFPRHRVLLAAGLATIIFAAGTNLWAASAVRNSEPPKSTSGEPAAHQ